MSDKSFVLFCTCGYTGPQDTAVAQPCADCGANLKIADGTFEEVRDFIAERLS